MTPAARAPKGLLEGRKLLITGGSRGIGAATAVLCAREGAFVGITYVSSEKAAEDVLKRIGPQKGCLFKADVANPEEMGKAASGFASSGPRKGIDGLVCNAGIYDRSGIMSLTMEGWNRTIETNLGGTFITIRSCLPFMERGSMVLVSSQIAFRGSDHGADYSSSKAGILGLARSLARELAPAIRVNAVAPGYIDTDILSGDPPEKRAKRASEVPLGRLGAPSDVASAIVFLLSDSSSYITGATLDVNGGLYIH